MEISFNLVKSSKVTILNALKYGFYILIKYYNLLYILLGFSFVIQIINIITSGILINSINLIDIYNMEDITDLTYLYNALPNYYLYIFINLLLNISLQIIQNYTFSRIYFKEWDIKRNFFKKKYFVFKTIILSVLIAILYFVLLIGIGIISSLVGLFSTFLGLTILIFAMLLFAIISVFFTHMLCYEYVINNNRIGVAFRQVILISKKNLAKIFQFNILYISFVILSCLLLIPFMFIIFLIPIMSYIITPLLEIAISTIVFFAYVIYYMNLKYRNGLNIFPDDFLDDEDNMNIEVTFPVKDNVIENSEDVNKFENILENEISNQD
ncbi:MAG: hypothetical protein ACK5LY_09185 [Lachnospirales bacterium]